jgi:hypothetical protein
MNAKLGVLSTIEQALNPKEIQGQKGKDYEFYLTIQPEKDSLWDLLESLNNQLYDIRQVANGISFEKFRLENQFASEDAFNAEEDLHRQQAWFDEVDGEIQALQEEKQGLLDPSTMQNDDPSTMTPSADDQARYDEIGDAQNGLLQPLMQERGQL